MKPLHALALPALAAVISPSLAQDVLRGDAAFGSWREDAPGVTRLITPADLDPPGATASNANPAGIADLPQGAAPQVPEGFRIEQLARLDGQPREMLVSAAGDLFVALTGGNMVAVLPGGDGDPVAFATGLQSPYGLALYPPTDPQWLYVAVEDGVVRIPFDGSAQPAGAPEYVLSDLPSGGHGLKDVTFTPDGSTMLVAVGSLSNVGNGMTPPPEGFIEAQPLGAAWDFEERRAMLLAFNPDGGNERIYATGLRNCSGLALQPATGLPWCAVNERDGLGDNVPFDYATSVVEGAFYGWPWYYIGANEDPRQAGVRPDLAGAVTVPDVLFQSHSAPLGIAFYDHDAFGPEYRGDAFVGLHGSWNRGDRTGYKVVRLDMDDQGRPLGTYQDFVTGFVLSSDEVWGRPVGVAVSPNGALYISEDGNGTIWRVTRDAR